MYKPIDHFWQGPIINQEERKKKENFEVFFNVQINALIFINNKYT